MYFPFPNPQAMIARYATLLVPARGTPRGLPAADPFVDMPFDPTDRLEDFLRRATASKVQEDPVVQAAIYRVQGYLRDRQPSIDPPMT